MMNVDPHLYQQKVIRMSTNVGIPGQHIIRTTEYNNPQVLTSASTLAHNEANNNILTSNNPDGINYPRRSTKGFHRESGVRDYRNYNEMDSMDPNLEERDLTTLPQSEWPTDQMYWTGEGEMPDSMELERLARQNSASIMSFQSDSSASASYHSQISEQSESREEEISLILNKVRSQNKVEASKILLTMSSTVENCIAMRNCGCLPLLIQLLHCPDENSNTYQMVHAKRIQFEVRERASQVLHNIVFSQPDDKKSRREARVLRLLEQIRDYCDQLRNQEGGDIDDNRNARSVEQQLGTSVASLMKLSFDEDHRYAMCQLGGLQAIAELLQIDQEVHGCTNDQYCITIRRYSGMVLTNLTFGDGANKTLLCSMRSFMEALVAQLYSPSEDLRQVTASVLRNLSWRADPASKRILREVGAVTMLVKAAMDAEKESTLKSILSALWNLSAHCSGNKADICHVDGALAFLVSTLTYKSKSKTLAIVENGGGILRNVSSHIAIQNDYRIILRKHNCLQILLQHLKSPSLTVVSNACGTLWNLSARNAVDQRALWEMGAVGMLKKLINSKHKMISMGSSAALKNLLSAKPPGVGVGLCVYGDNFKGNDDAPSLMVRKQKALNTEIDQNLTETYDITDSPKTSPVKQANDKQNRSRRHISPSARYMTNQKMRNELSLPSRSTHTDGLNSSIVVEEKHNGAFQVTKNAKQALSYRQSQNKFQQDAKDTTHTVEVNRQFDRRSAESGYESGRLGSAYGKSEKHSFSSVDHDRPKSNTTDSRNSSIPFKKENRTLDRVSQSAKAGRHNSLPNQNDSNDSIDSYPQQPPQKPFPESKIPLPKSFNPQRSQSASPVAQRRSTSQRQESQQVVNPVIPRNVDINITHPKSAWTSTCEKEDNDPEKPVNFSKRLGRDDNRSQENPHKLFVSRLQHQPPDEYNNDDEVKVYETENTPSNPSLMSSMNDLDDIVAGARCSLNIKTSTNVRMIKNHPLLVNASAYRAEEEAGRTFEPRYTQKQDHFGEIEEGKTIDFSVQSDYDIDETLSMMSRSSSMASISSFDQQSFHEDESFASDLSHRSSGIESPSELSDSPCQTAPSSPTKQLSLRGGLSDQVQITSSEPVRTDEEHVAEDSNAVVDISHTDEETVFIDEDHRINERSPTQSVQLNGIDVADSVASGESESKVTTNISPTSSRREQCLINRSGSSSCGTSLEDISPSDRKMIEECIRAGMPQPVSCQGARQKTQTIISPAAVEKHPNACNYEGGRAKLKNLEIKDTECESYSDNEEKGKEDERKAEKTRLFRIPESPVDKKVHSLVDSNKVEYVCSSYKTPELICAKVTVDRKGNRRFEKTQPKSKPPSIASEAESMPSQLSFLMRSSSESAQTVQANKERDSNINSPEDFTNAASRLDESENQELSMHEDSDNSYFTCYSETRSSEKDKRKSKTSDNSDYFQTVDDISYSSKNSKPKSPEELSEKDIDCSERDEDDETMIKSSILDEAKEIAQALLGARVDSTEDMTVSTLSCLSDIDNARPPSVMAEIGCLSMNSSTASEENLKIAVTRECQKLFGAKQSKKSLLRELQIGRLSSNDYSNGSNDSIENLSMRSSCASEFLGNVNPPSMLDEMSLTASTGSLEGSDSEYEPDRNFVQRYRKNQDSMSERMHDAAAMSKLYAKELSHITGNVAVKAEQDDSLSNVKADAMFPEVVEVTIADVTDFGCDTIGSDTELEDDLPCDDEDLSSETFQLPRQSSLKKEAVEEGSTENLTLTLTEEPPKPQISPYLDFQKQNVCFMTAEQLRALQENADMILNTLKDVEISDEETGGMSNGDMLEDETMSLVSNESDEEFLSPDGHQRFCHTQKTSPRSDSIMSPTCNGMVALPQSTSNATSKYSLRKSSLPQFSPRKKPGLPKPNDHTAKNRYSYPESTRNNFDKSADVEAQRYGPLNANNGSSFKMRPQQSMAKQGLGSSPPHHTSPTNAADEAFENGDNCPFDTRTFTRKRSSVPKEMIPSVLPSAVVSTNPMHQKAPLKSPSATNLPSFPPSPKIISSNIKTDPNKTVTSKIAGAWKNCGKARSKSAADTNRGSKLQLASENQSKDENRNGWTSPQRSSSGTSSPKSPLSRSSTFEKLNDENKLTPPSVRRPSSLAICQNSSSPRHTKGVPQRTITNSQKQVSGESHSNQRTVVPPSTEDYRRPSNSIMSPTTHQSGSNIPKSKAQVSLIPSRRSMIPTPAKFGMPEN